MRLALVLFPLTLLISAASPVAAQRIKLPVKLAELEQRVKADSNDAAAHYNVALGYWNEKRFDEAERTLAKSVELRPQNAQARLALGEAGCRQDVEGEHDRPRIGRRQARPARAPVRPARPSRTSATRRKPQRSRQCRR